MNIQRILSFVFISSVAIGVTFGAVTQAHAQIISTPPITVLSPCVNLTAGLWYGKHDSSTGGQVTVLQNFLQDTGYLNVSATGYFGPLTRSAVQRFQAENGLNADGIVGVQTRAHIYAKGCTISVPPTSVAPTIINGIVMYQGAVGSSITLPGSGFTANSILHFGIGAISNFSVNSTGTAITFTVPSYIGPYCAPGMACPMYAQMISNGSYPVYVQNSNGNSNTITFNVVNSPSVFPQ